MARPLSMDLRERVVGAVMAGKSCRSVAARFGTPEHGRWLIAPTDDVRRITRRYLPGTAILETSFETATGVATVTDFMPLSPYEDTVELVRIVSGVAGRVAFGMEFTLRFGYGRTVPWVRRPACPSGNG